jgi:hypothetical protein
MQILTGHKDENPFELIGEDGKVHEFALIPEPPEITEKDKRILREYLATPKFNSK